ncbi:MAG TPA: SpoIIE family protein phosphatase [Thermoanaerobaculia bacterium]|nr:SpoIIE family protein phosphatase [Thermoanaerobaculia bacterium]
MSSSRGRALIVYVLTLALVGAAVAYTMMRIAAWHEQGWTGVFYFPEIPGQKGEQEVLSGEVIMIYGGTPADGRILPADRIVGVNGIPVRNLAAVRAIEEKLVSGDEVRYQVRRGRRIVEVPLRLASPLRSHYIVTKTVVSFGVALIFVGVAVFVALRRADDRRATVFYAFALVSAMALIGGAATVYESAGGRGIAPTFGIGNVRPLLFFLFTIAYAPLILHLALIFPRERPIVQRHPLIIRWIYAEALLVALLVLSIGALVSFFVQNAATASRAFERSGYVVGRSSTLVAALGLILALHIIHAGRREGVAHAFARRPFRAVFAIFAVTIATTTLMARYVSSTLAGITGAASIGLPLLILAGYPFIATAALVRSYRAAGVEEKRQVKWPLWGLVIALTVKIIGNIVSFGIGIAMRLAHVSTIEYRVVFQALDIVPTVVSVVVPISFAVAILKYRLMNIDLLIRRTVVYAILSGAIVVVYLGLVGGLGTILVNVAGLKNQTMVIASTLIVALLFVPVRNKLQTLVDRNLFRHKYDYPEALRAIATETRMARDAGEFLASAAEKLQQALQSRALVIFAERQDEYVATAKIGVSDALIGHLRVSRKFADMLDRPFDPRRRNVPEDAAKTLSRIDAVLVAPIGSRGFVALAPKLSGGEFDVEDIDFLRSAADQIGIGVDRIRMQVEEEDYAQAREIQETLLPREMPSVERLELSGVWQPARTMGGDYYDLLKLGEHELAVCIGDVAGKGMPAALLMSGLQAAVRASASNSPRDLCERVRRVVVSSLSGGRFVTFFYAMLDTASMTMRWCNAGHNAPILVRADGTMLRLTDGGPAFTRLFRDAYQERELALLPGDRLVLFTDGVSEATDAAGEQFSEERIEELVADSRELDANELQRTIVDAASSFAGGELEDDLTLVVVRVQ